MEQYSLKQRINYFVDKIFSKGWKAMLVALFTISVLVIAFISWGIIKADCPRPENVKGAARIFWYSVARTLDPGSLQDDPIDGFGWFMLFISVFGIFVIGFLINIIGQFISSKVEELRQGKTELIEKGHIVILGWNDLVFQIVDQVITSTGKNQKKVVAVMGPRKKVQMEDEIRLRLQPPRRVKVYCRTGNQLQTNDLELMHLERSKAVIILPSDAKNSDLSCLKTILAIKSCLREQFDQLNLVAAVNKQENKDLAEKIYPRIKCINLSDLLGKIIAHTSLQPGLSKVYSTLLQFEDCEFYVNHKPMPEYYGQAFKGLIHKFGNSILTGILEKSNNALMNPQPDRVYQEGEKLIFIAEDEEPVTISKDGAHHIQEDKIRDAPTTIQPRKILVLGWNYRAEWVVKELNEFVPKGSECHVYCDSCMQNEAEFNKLNSITGNITLQPSYQNISCYDRLNEMELEKYHHIILLSCTDSGHESEPDTKTIVSLLHLRDILKKRGLLHNLIVELDDDRNRQLIDTYDVDDIIVSSFYLGMALIQVAQEPARMSVFDNLFNSIGSEIYLKPAQNYVALDVEVNFHTVMEAALRKNEIALGYKKNGLKVMTPGQGIVLNPVKTQNMVFTKDDHMIVLAENY